MNKVLQTELTLPCGAVLPNRIAKAALTEGLADRNGSPTAELNKLYGLWSDGGAGLILSGNIQIDVNHLERPGNVIIASEPQNNQITALKAWSAEATRNSNHFWAQIKALIWIIFHPHTIIRRRLQAWKLRRVKDSEIFDKMYPQSIVWQYFVKQLKTYNQLKGKR